MHLCLSKAVTQAEALILASEMKTVPGSHHSSGLSDSGLSIGCIKLWEGSGFQWGVFAG